MESVMAPCRCAGESCTHHKPGEHCPNRMIAPVGFIVDPSTQAPVAGSERGMCQVCWDNYYDTIEKEEHGEAS